MEHPKARSLIFQWTKKKMGKNSFENFSRMLRELAMKLHGVRSELSPLNMTLNLLENDNRYVLYIHAFVIARVN